MTRLPARPALLGLAVLAASGVALAAPEAAGDDLLTARLGWLVALVLGTVQVLGAWQKLPELLPWAKAHKKLHERLDEAETERGAMEKRLQLMERTIDGEGDYLGLRKRTKALEDGQAEIRRESVAAVATVAERMDGILAVVRELKT